MDHEINLILLLARKAIFIIGFFCLSQTDLLIFWEVLPFKLGCHCWYFWLGGLSLTISSTTPPWWPSAVLPSLHRFHLQDLNLKCKLFFVGWVPWDRALPTQWRYHHVFLTWIWRMIRFRVRRCLGLNSCWGWIQPADEHNGLQVCEFGNFSRLSVSF